MRNYTLVLPFDRSCGWDETTVSQIPDIPAYGLYHKPVCRSSACLIDAGRRPSFACGKDEPLRTCDSPLAASSCQQPAVDT
jgi:hypothetical protein